MIKLIKGWLETKEQEQALEKTRLQVEQKSLRRLEEATNLITERPDTGGWFRGGEWQFKHDSSARQSMVSQARNMFRFDPNARGLLSTLVYYIIGEGVKITPQSKDPRIHRLWREFWNSSRNKMPLRQAEIILRTLRDGEVFLQFHQKNEDGSSNWKTTVRFRDPELLQTPTLEYAGPGNAAEDGILMQPDDPETPVKYFFRKAYNNPVGTDVVPAEDIIHIKIFADSEQKRGETYIQPVMEMMGQYKEWLRYRIVLNKVRTALVLIKKVTGGSDDVARIQATMGTSPTANTGENKKRIPPPGTVITANAGVDYKFESANINAGDAAEDGRSMKLGMAAGGNVPEYTFGDASNANYASTLIAESPFVKGIRFWQMFFEWHLKEMFKKVVQAAVDAGKLTAPEEDDIFAQDGEPEEKPVQEAELVPPEKKPLPGEPQEKPKAKPGEEPVEGEEEPQGNPAHEFSEFEAFWGCDVQWPEVVHREMDKTSNAVISMVQAKLISESTASSILGYDYEEEVRKQKLIEEGAAENPFKQGGNAFDGPTDMDAEAEDIMKDLTPEESDELMKSGDPKAMMKMVAKKKAEKAGKKGGIPNA